MNISKLLASSVDMGHGRSSTLIDLIEGWAGHVVRLHAEAPQAPSTYTWGAHDLVAALIIRDFVERGLAVDPIPVPAILQAVDELFRSFTVLDDSGDLRRIDPEVAHEGWWWTRIPSTGLVEEELRHLRGS